MSAELLLSAAALMRDRARTATQGPWKVVSSDVGPYGILSDTEKAPAVYSTNAGAMRSVDMWHAASWHPLVAFAVADWLDHAAARAESKVGHGGIPSAVWSHERDALAVARAYLGGDGS